MNITRTVDAFFQSIRRIFQITFKMEDFEKLTDLYCFTGGSMTLHVCIHREFFVYKLRCTLKLYIMYVSGNLKQFTGAIMVDYCGT